MTAASHTQEVVLYALGRGRYRVEQNGETLLASSDDPELEACRALRRRGVTGTLRSRHAGSAHYALSVDIEIGAGLTVEEGRLQSRGSENGARTRGLRFLPGAAPKRRPFQMGWLP